jgi:protein-disulfide isomerase
MNDNSTNSPWFAVSMGLLGIIIGFSIGSTGWLSSSTGTAIANVPTPDAPTAPTPAPAADVPEVTGDDHVRGNPNAKVTVVEYSDIECPFCKRHHPTLVQLLDLYGDDVNWVYRHFPLSSIHPNAQKAAEATECVASLKKDAFWPYLDALIAAPALGEDAYVTAAKAQGVNEAAFRDCLTSGKFAQLVTDQQNGGAGAGVQGTPANFIIDNDSGDAVTIDGAAPLSNFQSAIDAILN